MINIPVDWYYGMDVQFQSTITRPVFCMDGQSTAPDLSSGTTRSRAACPNRCISWAPLLMDQRKYLVGGLEHDWDLVWVNGT